MNKQKKSFYSFFVPATLVAAFIFVLWQNWSSRTSQNVSSTAQQTFPNFQLSNLFNPINQITNEQLLGHVSLVNIWASWCTACREEHPFLMKIKEIYAIPIYGILYNDTQQDAKNWLKKAGNPYTTVMMDSNQRLAKQLQLIGVPETLIVDKQGVIRFRLMGKLTKEEWDNILYPIVAAYQ